MTLFKEVKIKLVRVGDLKFKFGDYVGISKYKPTFAKGHTANWFREVFVTKRVKNIVPCIYAINELNGE